ncbi:hypothetical protein KUTeg_004638 [Tegillarca granosa]|uniref:Uncharacterized protein n=1 Tax=Tegillarca granosa TaxID=220873 RepID=A0ABQ9FM53_TEGGR|nr:hypothetical protein KUTeg_004638 [Tegillarca granosa]
MNFKNLQFKAFCTLSITCRDHLNSRVSSLTSVPTIVVSTLSQNRVTEKLIVNDVSTINQITIKNCVIGASAVAIILLF